jgi:hypothetical protein
MVLKSSSPVVVDLAVRGEAALRADCPQCLADARGWVTIWDWVLPGGCHSPLIRACATQQAQPRGWTGLSYDDCCLQPEWVGLVSVGLALDAVDR